MRTNELRAYHGDPTIKAKYLKRVRAHAKADRLIQGTGWDGGKGCAVGCTLEAYDHARYPIELGIPEWLAQVEDCIFEGLTKARAQRWPAEFLSAIRPGADLSKVEAPFVIYVLKSNLRNFDHKKFPAVVAATKECIRLYRLGDLAPSRAWNAARSAAESAARSARSAAESARIAARSAAESAARSAWNAARTATYVEFADKLLSLLSGAR